MVDSSLGPNVRMPPESISTSKRVTGEPLSGGVPPQYTSIRRLPASSAGVLGWPGSPGVRAAAVLLAGPTPTQFAARTWNV